MGKEYFETFKNSNDLFHWQKHIDYIKITESISSEEVRAEVINSLQLLSDELGKHFLKNCKQTRHPLFAYLFERSDQSYSWLIEFADTLRKLKNTDPNYHDFIKLLRPAKKFHDEGLPFVNISRSFLESGFLVNVFPDVQQQKKPDLKISNVKNGEVIFIEVTRPAGDTGIRELIRQNSQSIFKALHLTPPYVEFSCKQKRVLTESELLITLDEIISAKVKSHHYNCFEVLENDRIDLAVAPVSKIGELQNWCLANKRQLDFSPLSLNYDDTEKISGDKIKTECEQLPVDSAGILYIQVNPLYFWAADLENAKVRFLNRLKDFPNVIGIVLFSYIGAFTEDSSVIEGKDYFGSRMVTAGVSRTIVFFYSKSFNGKLSAPTLQSFYSSLEKF
jgi:hypothetical protein